VPSLDNLNKFRGLFRSIGKEAEDLASKGISFADLDLPDDRKPSSPAGNIPTQRENAADDASDTAEYLKALDAAPDFDLDALFDDDPAPLKPTEGAEAAGDTVFNLDDLFDADESNSSASADGFLFDDLFDNADAPDAPSIAESMPLEDSSGFSPDDLNMDEMPDFDDMAAPLPPLDADSFPPDGSAVGAEGFSPDDLNMDELPDFDDAAAPLPPLDADSFPPDDLNMDELPDFDDAAAALPPLDADSFPPDG
jgi:hypothetical protein